MSQRVSLEDTIECGVASHVTCSETVLVFLAWLTKLDMIRVIRSSQFKPCLVVPCYLAFRIPLGLAKFKRPPPRWAVKRHPQFRRHCHGGVRVFWQERGEVGPTQRIG